MISENIGLQRPGARFKPDSHESSYMVLRLLHGKTWEVMNHLSMRLTTWDFTRRPFNLMTLEPAESWYEVRVYRGKLIRLKFCAGGQVAGEIIGEPAHIPLSATAWLSLELVTEETLNAQRKR